MKTYLTFLGVLFICAFAKATTTTSASQDKPDRLYVESYTDNETSEEIQQIDNYDNNGNPAPDQYGYIWENDDPLNTYTVNWNDGSTGNALWREHNVFTSNVTNTMGDAWASIYWPTGSWPNIPVGTWTNSDGDTESADSPVVLEHCDTGLPLDDQTGSYLYPPPGSFRETIIDFATRHAQAKMTLQTGGRSGSRLHNLFGFTASATQIIGVKDPPPFNENNLVQNISIPQPNIVLGSLGNLNATGATYRTLPDDTTVDVTPTVAGVDYFTFGITEAKYHSYFDVFVDQPDPTGNDIWGLDDAGGHAWWRLRTDAPGDAINQFISNQLMPFLDTQIGFGPTNSVNVTSTSPNAPGQLRNPETDVYYSIYRKYYISFSGIAGGLTYTKDLNNNPGTYKLYSFNCVDAVISAASASGRSLPDNTAGWPFSNPENFGRGLPPSD